MGFRDLLPSWVPGSTKARRRSNDEGSQHPPWLGSASAYGFFNTWTDSRYELVRHYQGWVFIAISKICEKIATTPVNVSILRKHGQSMGNIERRLHPADRAKALMPMSETDELEHVDDEHPLLKILQQPNYYDTSYQLWYETIMFLLLTGSAYWWCPRNKLGLPTEIWVLPSHWIKPLTGKDRLIDGYRMQPYEGNYAGLDLPPEEVLAFQRKSPISKFDGYSPQTAGATWIDAQRSVDRSRASAFRNGIFPGQLAIEFDSAVNAPSEAQLERIAQKLMDRYGGEQRAGTPLLAPPGTKVKPLSIAPREMDFQGSFEQLRDSILALFGVPAVIAGIVKDMTYGSVEASKAAFSDFTINPLCQFLGETLTAKLAKRFDPKLCIWWSNTRPVDGAQQNQDIQTDALCSAITPNEVRRIRGRAPLTTPEADQPIQQGMRKPNARMDEPK